MRILPLCRSPLWIKSELKLLDLETGPRLYEARSLGAGSYGRLTELSACSVIKKREVFGLAGLPQEAKKRAQ